MSELKKHRVRAIIFKDEHLVSMYRERNDRIYYVFPGGGMEGKETEKECIKRELLEEFGLIVKPVKKVYIYDGKAGIEHFYICKWLSGKFEDAKGEEFQSDRNRGVYKQTLIEISKIPSLPLMPPEIASLLVADYNKNGEFLRNDIKFVVDSETINLTNA